MKKDLIQSYWEKKEYKNIIPELPSFKKVHTFSSEQQKEIFSLYVKVYFNASQLGTSKEHTAFLKIALSCLWTVLENPTQEMMAYDAKKVLLDFVHDLFEGFKEEDKEKIKSFFYQEEKLLHFLKEKILQFPEIAQKILKDLPVCAPYAAMVTGVSSYFFEFLCEVSSDAVLKDWKMLQQVACYSDYAPAFYCLKDNDISSAFLSLVKLPFDFKNKKTKKAMLLSLIGQHIFFEKGFQDFKEGNPHCNKIFAQVIPLIEQYPYYLDCFSDFFQHSLHENQWSKGVFNGCVSSLEKIYQKLPSEQLKKILSEVISVKAITLFSRGVLDLKEAEVMVEKALSIDPKSTEALMVLETLKEEAMFEVMRKALYKLQYPVVFEFLKKNQTKNIMHKMVKLLNDFTQQYMHLKQQNPELADFAVKQIEEIKEIQLFYDLVRELA